MKRPRSRPFVFINMAMTADGKIATANRAVSTFGSKRDLEHLYELRATADAVMAGARTVGSNAVTMGPGGRRFEARRLRNGLARYNARVIVSGSGSINPDATIFRHRFSPIILLTSERISRARLRRLEAVADDVLVAGGSEIDFSAALQHLQRRWNIRRLLCEGGGELNDALFRAGLVDELHLTVCPKVFGGSMAPTIADGLGAPSLAGAKVLQLKTAKQVGGELFLVYRVPQERRNRVTT